MNRAAMKMLKKSIYGIYSVTPTYYSGYGSYFRLPLPLEAHEMLLEMYSELFELRDSNIYFKGALGKYILTPIEIKRTGHPLVAEILNGSNQSRMFLRLDHYKGTYFITSKLWEGLFFRVFKANGIKKMINKYNIGLQYGNSDVILYDLSDNNLEAVIRNYKIKSIIESERIVIP